MIKPLRVYNVALYNVCAVAVSLLRPESSKNALLSVLRPLILSVLVFTTSWRASIDFVFFEAIPSTLDTLLVRVSILPVLVLIASLLAAVVLLILVISFLIVWISSVNLASLASNSVLLFTTVVLRASILAPSLPSAF